MRRGIPVAVVAMLASVLLTAAPATAATDKWQEIPEFGDTRHGFGKGRVMFTGSKEFKFELQYRSPNTKNLYLVVKLVYDAMWDHKERIAPGKKLIGDNQWHTITGSYDGWMPSVEGVRFMYCEDKGKKNDPCFTSSFTVENPY